MLNSNRSQVKVKSHEALAISDTEDRGSAPAPSLVATAKPGLTEIKTSKTQNGFSTAFQMGVFCLVLFAVFVSVAAGNVEFKHHNNTEMAEVLQQIHNRYDYIFYTF